MEQQIRFCTTTDGVSIAYWTMGEGLPFLYMPSAVFNPVHRAWHTPEGRRWIERLASSRMVIRYDHRGFGESQQDVDSFSRNDFVLDLEAVVDQLGLERFALFGNFASGPIAVAYAARQPKRVSHLILWCTFARGSDLPRFRSLQTAEWEVFTEAMALGVFGWSAQEQARDYASVLRRIPRPERVREAMAPILDCDLTDLLPTITCPTLVLHRRQVHLTGLAVAHVDAARFLAARIPGASMRIVEGESGAAFVGDMDEVLEAMDEFLQLTPQPAPTGESGGAVSQEARSSISELDVIVLSRFNVIGNYIRYDEMVRNILKDARQKIVSGLNRPGRKRENHLIWAAPGSGKTYFVEQVGASLAGSIYYLELNLAKRSESEFLAALGELENRGQPCLCLVDEIDAKPDEAWPYEVLLPYLDAGPERGIPLVFVLAGSGGESVIELKQRLAGRPKGKDLLSRIPSENECEIAPLGILDRVLVVLSQIGQAAREAGREIRAVEKFALYYVAVNPRLSNARQLREFAVRAVDRAGPDEDRVKYDHLFGAGDQENKEFWMRAGAVADDLQNRFVIVES